MAGNGSYILRPCGHDLHGPTIMVMDREIDMDKREVEEMVFTIEIVQTLFFVTMLHSNE